MRIADGILMGAICLGVATTSAASGPSVDIPTRARGAQRIVVAIVVDVQSVMARNGFGDQIIVSRLLLKVQETMKGEPASAVSLDVEGGTVGTLTLRVSDMPTLNLGDRAVFFTNPGPRGTDVPHLRGLGIVKLNAVNRVVDENSLTLDDLRRSVEASR